MIIYNVTVNVDDSVNETWVSWMKEVHIPDVMNTNCFKESRFSRIISDHVSEGTNYSIQYLCESHEVLEGYQKKYAPALQQEHIEKFGEKALAFRTLLEVL